MKSKTAYSVLTVLCLLAFCLSASAQFKTDAFSQGYGDDVTTSTDSTETWFSFKEYFGGLAHKNTLKIGTLFGGSAVFIGGQQIYHKQYWKLPIIYGGLGATVGMGFHYKNQGNTKMSTLMFAGAGALYWATMFDGAASYNKGVYPQAGKATIYSILCPGLGQIYNREYWKLPIYWGCLMGGIYYYSYNKTNYERFQRLYKEATDPETQATASISSDTALYYRDIYRRYRDYSVLAIAAFYLIQVIDANVFAYMYDFEVNDDISMKVSPTIIAPDNQFALNTTGVGLSLGIRF